ncbi:MAG TPA: phosphatidate cytidylyltransferase [Vicinamibacterales bacterium]|nr:phosphatidate cytidylyltransferase [Vicinamibacterales bacterium]
MIVRTDGTLLGLFGAVVAMLAAASAVGAGLRWRARSDGARATMDEVNARIRGWWVMASIFMVSVVAGPAASILLFAAVSFLALREFVTLMPASRADHRALLWCFFVAIPLQYALVAVRWYGLFAILVPIYLSLFVVIRSAIGGDTGRFAERAATIQLALLICVYFVSYVPALLMLRIPSYRLPNAGLIFFLVFVVQLSDVLQYVWGKSLGRRRIAPSVSPNKTWEGFAGGTLSATAAGTAIWWVTPFSPAQAAVLALAVALMGFAGGLVMSAIKRDAGVKDYGSLIPGHGGVLDRIDSLCFAAPVFFHVTRYFFALS